jgi:hypothetical protein
MNQTNRYEREILGNTTNIIAISNAVSQQLGRQLTKPEASNLLAFIRNYSTSDWTKMSTADIRNALTLNYIESYHTDNGRRRRADATSLVDIHELMKRQIGTATQDADPETADDVDADGNPHESDTDEDTDTLGNLDLVKTVNTVDAVTSIGNISSFLGKNNDSSIQTLLNPQAAWRKNYIILDSRYRDTSQDVAGLGITNFIWNFLANSTINTPGAVNSVGTVQNVVSFSCPNIRIPYTNNAFINAYKRITMLVNEFSGQSYVGQEGTKFHMIFSTAIDQSMVDCTALPDSTSVFEFAKPITQLDSFTVSFACPLETITFDMDRLVMSVSYAPFNPVAPQDTFTSTTPHNLTTGDQIYITNFTTNDPTTDVAIIAAANRASGYNVYVNNPNGFYLPDLDLSAVTAPINPYSILIYFGSKRIFIPLELKYISQIGQAS